MSDIIRKYVNEEADLEDVLKSEQSLDRDDEKILVGLYSTDPGVVGRWRDFLPVISVAGADIRGITFSSPVEDPDDPSEINQVIATQGNQKADIFVENEGFERVSAKLGTSLFNENVFVDIEGQRQVAMEESFELVYSRQFQDQYLGNIRDIAESKGLLGDELADDVEQFRNTGERSAKIEQNADVVAKEISEWAESVAEGWASRYLQQVNDARNFFVRSSELNIR